MYVWINVCININSWINWGSMRDEAGVCLGCWYFGSLTMALRVAQMCSRLVPFKPNPSKLIRSVECLLESVDCNSYLVCFTIIFLLYLCVNMGDSVCFHVCSLRHLLTSLGNFVRKTVCKIPCKRNNTFK